MAALPLTQDAGQVSGQPPTTYPNNRMAVQLTQRDESILVALTKRIRCVNADLAARYFWPQSTDGQIKSLRRLRQLQSAGWLSSQQGYAKRLPLLTRPVVTWSLSDPAPDFGWLSNYLKTRFKEPTRTMQIFIATRQAAVRYGGTGDRWPRRSETTHDLGLAQVYLHLLESDPMRASAWVSEASLVARGTHPGEKLPDAIIRPATGRESVIEFGGQYGKEKLQAFHDYCVNAFLEYELW